jgi:hypothetical protein
MACETSHLYEYAKNERRPRPELLGGTASVSGGTNGISISG